MFTLVVLRSYCPFNVRRGFFDKRLVASATCLIECELVVFPGRLPINLGNPYLLGGNVVTGELRSKRHWLP